MVHDKPILIACPQYRVTVRGWYKRDSDGTCQPGPDGKYILSRVRCNQYDGRCAQTLCVLHRYNNRGQGSWYPEIVLAYSREPDSLQQTGANPGSMRR